MSAKMFLRNNALFYSYKVKLLNFKIGEKDVEC